MPSLSEIKQMPSDIKNEAVSQKAEKYHWINS